MSTRGLMISGGVPIFFSQGSGVGPNLFEGLRGQNILGNLRENVGSVIILHFKIQFFFFGGCNHGCASLVSTSIFFVIQGSDQ